MTTTAKKTAASRRTATPAADLAVDFNFDTWEREVEVKPYVTVIGGKPYTATDPAEVDYRELNQAMRSLDDEELFKLLFPKDHPKILATKVIKAGAMDAFTTVVMEHYQLGPTADSEHSSEPGATQ